MSKHLILGAKHFEIEGPWDNEIYAAVRYRDDIGAEKWLTASQLTDFTDFYVSDEDISNHFIHYHETGDENALNEILKHKISVIEDIPLSDEYGLPIDLSNFENESAYGLLLYIYTLLKYDDENLIKNSIGKYAEDLELEYISGEIYY